MATVLPPKAPRFLSRLFSSARVLPDETLVGPIRGELLGAERLAEHARHVARKQRVLIEDRRRGHRPLLRRLDETRNILDNAREVLAEASDRDVDISPAGEWLLDNFYVVQEHIREVRASMPRRYYLELPKLAVGTLAGYPRVYDLAIELIAHSEGHVEQQNIELFTREFQRVSPLSLGELWAIPTMLRLGLVENIRRMTLRVMQRLREVAAADEWAERIRDASSISPQAQTAVLNEFVASPPDLTPAFVTRFLQQIRAFQTGFTPLVWLEQWIAEDGMTADEAVTRANQRLALTQVMMANSITSLRAIARLDWKSFVESQSVTERMLRRDPVGFYAQLTFGTRDHYRHVVETVARRSGHREDEIAMLAVELAKTAPPGRSAHVGYWLIDDGRVELERRAGYHPSIGERIHRFVLRHPAAIYFGAILAGTAAALSAPLLFAGAESWPFSWSLVTWLVALLALIPASEIAIGTVNQIVTVWLPPRTLPKVDMREQGIPEEFSTVVVVPTLLASVEAVDEALEHLEVQFLANRDSHLRFALLSDFTDAATEHAPGDEAILRTAIEGVEALNRTYGDKDGEPFYLFHRPRRWNPVQGVWMAWERKRGKLGEFNRFLRGEGEDAFSTIIGDIGPLRKSRYVITLDSDTVLPPDAAHLMVGSMAHPLNRPEYDASAGRVVRGYAILQPRIGISLTSAHRSRFASIHSGHPGVDPYTTAVSDVYQDLFAEGSFTGKGIYDVDLFERAVEGRFPENTLLSHDLIEGAYARAGLLTDIELFDDYPTRYLTFTRRKHRWIRGDWQLLRWLGGTVPGPRGDDANRLSAISRWKIFDNLRRSVVEIAQLVFLVAGWTILPGSPAGWTALALGAVAFPWLFSATLAIIRPPRDKSWIAYYAAVWGDLRVSAQQIALAIVFLPHQAWVSADAIVRTLHRLFVSHRYLLEWQTASQTERSITRSSREYWRRMREAVLLASGIGIIVLLEATTALGNRSGAPGSPGPFDVQLLLAAVPLIAVWIASPRLAHWLSAPALREELTLTASERPRALRYALLQWRFFDRFVTEQTHWLAPDNFQETPDPVVAMRTSPTNVGLQLLSTVSAHDLGFLTRGEMIERVEKVLRTLERLRRFRGHFYNWYDLELLTVLEPAYVSTVDSGNFAGHMLALKHACAEIADQASAEPATIERRYRTALITALELARDLLRDQGTSGAVAEPAAWQALRSCADALRAALDALRKVPASPGSKSPGGAEPFAKAVAALMPAETQVGLLDGVEQAAEAARWIRWSRSLAEDVIAELSRSGDAARADERRRLEAIALRAQAYVNETDFTFLFDTRRKLFSIGYQVASAQLDNSYYDLLASESRLASFLAIAKGDVPLEHWFRLGRTLTQRGTATALVSWSGSMFEYLMPALVMRRFPHTLLDQTYRGAVRRHIEYGIERGVPWGNSESAYNVRDREQTYQYKAFGVPDLALKRGLRKDLVVAPYATLLATQVEPHEAMRNLAVLEAEGALGPYGFRESIDYTRPGTTSDKAVVAAYFAHHIGMGLVALHNALEHRRWQERFHADPMVRAAELVLFERVPRRLVMQELDDTDPDEALPGEDQEQPAARVIETPDTPYPHIGLLGGTPYTVMLTNAGGGYSRHGELAVTRWRNDGTGDQWGQWCYVRDVSTNRVWSASHQPVCAKADWYRAIFATDRVTFHRRDESIETQNDITVVPEDGAEVRRITVTNHSLEPRVVELTSYGEVVMTPPDADRAHPAFHNLFVETEWLPNLGAILATRRPRASQEARRWCVHVVACGKEKVGEITYETDRARFVGRGRSTRDPAALDSGSELSGTVGAVLDPIMSLRVRVRLAPGQFARVAFTTLVTETRARAEELADRYNDPYAAQRSLDLSWTHSQVELRDLGMTPAEAAMYQQLAGHLFNSYAPLRAPQHELAANRGHQELLWSLGVSGDLPILLALIDSAAGMPSVRQLLRAHQYWRLKGVTVDLVFLNTHPPTYLQELGDQLLAVVMASSEATLMDQPGGVFIRRKELLNADVLDMLRATARVHVTCDGLGIGKVLEAMEPEQLALSEGGPESHHLGGGWTGAGRRSRSSGLFALTQPPLMPPGGNLVMPRAPVVHAVPRITRPIADPRRLEGFNLIGGINREGEYEMRLDAAVLPPAPWSNVIANQDGGFLITERGGGYSWAENSYFFRLTPWSNDPVSDPVGETIYITDEESHETWGAMPAPVNHGALFTVRHAHGCTVFAQEHAGIASTLVVGMPERGAVKISLLRLDNRGQTPRKIRVTSYAEWTLGVMREHTQHQMRTFFDHGSSALFAQNYFDPAFAGMTAFSFVSETLTSYTADRREFIGRNGHVGKPAGVRRPRLSEVTGVGFDPCAALQCTVELEPGETREIAVLLGAAHSEDDARALIAQYGTPGAARAALDSSVAAWRHRLSAVTVRTPSREFDAMANGWLLYQALACRVWGRSALYQSSGAYGFRDQLQDVLALVHAEPQLAREHILRAAGRQFVEGDVQHWWHPHTGRGVRTKFSDDLAWLPYVVEGYIAATGDASILDEQAPFITMRLLNADEHEIYDLPQPAGEQGTIYEHCLRALRRASTTGVHGLPLIGIGDWNDGMNRVGAGGKGESVWLAWFLATTMRRFAPICEGRADAQAAATLRQQADAYVASVEQTSWDGAWYRRAYFDDGTPLGSAANTECRIDNIAQSWSVISGAGRPERAAQAMRSMREHLIDEEARLIKLLTPPFDTAPYDPGYIKGYVPGVRENGAQYTHAALWAVLATALQGDGDEAFRLFQMINPLMHSRTPEEVATYMVEPYVVAADVYTSPLNRGRGGWTWYTGSASWMYRTAVEGIVGVRRAGEVLHIEPCVPKDWAEFGVDYRYGSSTYVVTVKNPASVCRGVCTVTVDGVEMPDRAIRLVDDGARHDVVVEMGETPRKVTKAPVA